MGVEEGERKKDRDRDGERKNLNTRLRDRNASLLAGDQVWTHQLCIHSIQPSAAASVSICRVSFKSALDKWANRAGQGRRCSHKGAAPTNGFWASQGWKSAGLRPAAQHMSLPVPILLWVMAEIQGLEELKPTPVVIWSLLLMDMTV